MQDREGGKDDPNNKGSFKVKCKGKKIMSQDLMGLKKIVSHSQSLLSNILKNWLQREDKTQVLQITYGIRFKITKWLLRFFVKISKNFKVFLNGTSKTLNSMLYRLSVNRDWEGLGAGGQDLRFKS